MERKEMQPVLAAAITTTLEEKDVPKDSDHMRRTVRCLIRLAARVLINSGAPLGAFVQLAVNCYLEEMKETGVDAISVSLQVPGPPSDAN